MASPLGCSAGMGLIDTHTHLESFVRQGREEEVLSRAREAGLDCLVTIGTSTEDWSLYRQLAQRYPGFVRYTAGLHPCAVDEGWERQVEALPAFFEGDNSAQALGETGLDRFHLPKEDSVKAEQIIGWQKEAFDAQLQLAKRFGCPLVVHSRGAFAECVEMIDASGLPWSKVVFHCFTESEAEMRVLMQRGGLGSFTGVLTYKSAENVRQAARLQGLDRFMLETDAPYLTPMPHRGKPNEPAYLRHTAEFAAKVFGVPFEQLERSSSENARRFYGF